MPSPVPSRWRLFEIHCALGATPLLVEHRLLGFRAQYRTLTWRAAFTRFAAAGGSPPSSYAQWQQFENIAADGLACWPEWVFGELPDQVAIEGAWSNGKFRADRYRLYERTRATRFLPSNPVPEPEPVEHRWSFRAGDAHSPVPDLSAAKRSPESLANALEMLLESRPVLLAGDRAIIFAGEEYHRSKPVYFDPDFATDRFIISPPYRGQERFWEVGEYNSVQIGTRRRRTLERAEHGPRKDFLSRLFARPSATVDKRGKENWPMDRLLRERATAAFATALFEIPAGEAVGGSLVAPPLKVILTHGWLQGGYLPGRVELAQTLVTDEFVAAFADSPPAPARVATRPEVNFDPDSATLAGPSGQSLHFERRLGQAGGEDAFLLRCRAAGLDWPVPVRRSGHVREKLMRWTIDHDAALALWRAETGGALPEPDRWDRLRQFLEDAVLSWPDTSQAGAAAQELVTTGGWYDGRWWREPLVRTLQRPMPFEERQSFTADAWIDYSPQEQWVRIDDLPIGLPDRPYGDPSYVYSGGGKDPPIPFAKKQLAGDGMLQASVYTVGYAREEAHRTDYADFRAGRDRLRIAGVRSAFNLGSVWRVAEEPPPDLLWKGPPGTGAQPDLPTWRRLRDAAESGLRPGESVTTSGRWIFNRFFGGYGSRKLELLNG